MSDHTRLCARLRELSYAVTLGEAGMREFVMRIPAEPARDADFVLANAADLIERQAARIAELEAAARWRTMIECPKDASEIVVLRKGGILDIEVAAMTRCELAGGDQSAIGWLPIPEFEEPKP